MRGGLDAVSAMWYNEYHTLMSYGLSPQDMTAFFLRDLGLNFPEDSLYMLRPTAARPGLAAGLRAGTREGWGLRVRAPGRDPGPGAARDEKKRRARQPGPSAVDAGAHEGRGPRQTAHRGPLPVLRRLHAHGGTRCEPTASSPTPLPTPPLSCRSSP